MEELEEGEGPKTPAKRAPKRRAADTSPGKPPSKRAKPRAGAAVA